MSAKTVGFVIPVYNEEKIIAEELSQLLGFVDSLDHSAEVTVVENGSQDKTAEILDRISDDEPSVKALHLDRANYGLALKAGLDAVEATHVFLLNIDFLDEEFIRNALELLDDYDMVIGSKSHSQSFDNRSVYRQFLTWGLNFLLGLMVGFQGTETHGLKGLRRSSVEPFLDDIQLDRGMFDTELVVRAQYESLAIKEIPVSLEEDREPRNWMLQKIYQNVVDIMKLTLVIRGDYGFFNDSGNIVTDE